MTTARAPRVSLLKRCPPSSTTLASASSSTIAAGAERPLDTFSEIFCRFASCCPPTAPVSTLLGDAAAVDLLSDEGEGSTTLSVGPSVVAGGEGFRLRFEGVAESDQVKKPDQREFHWTTSNSPDAGRRGTVGAEADARVSRAIMFRFVWFLLFVPVLVLTRPCSSRVTRS